MTSSCKHHNYFERICKPAVGIVTDYYDGKSRCYPHLSYSVQFNVDDALVSVRLCASDVERVLPRLK